MHAGEQQLVASAWYELVLQNQRLAYKPGNDGSSGIVSKSCSANGWRRCKPERRSAQRKASFIWGGGLNG